MLLKTLVFLKILIEMNRVIKIALDLVEMNPLVRILSQLVD